MNFLYPGVAKLQNKAITDIHKVIMLLEFKASFKLCTIVAKLMLGNQVTIE